MHQILSGINTSKLLDKLKTEFKYNYPCIYIIDNIVLVIDYYMYHSTYQEKSKEPVDITEDKLNKAITIYELSEDDELALESLRN